MKKLGGQYAYPTGKQEGYSAAFGLTYRQYLAAEIAGHLAACEAFTSTAANNVKERTGNYEECLKLYGRAVWMLADAVLETEHET